MTTGCKIYSPEHAEALHRAQRAPAHLNLATNDAGRGSSHRCQVMSGSSTMIIPTKTYGNIQATEMMVVAAWVMKSRYGDRITLGCFLIYRFSSSLLESRPGTNGVGTGFITCHCRWSFPVCQIRRKVTLCGTYR
jgi:hypothetical protein